MSCIGNEAVEDATQVPIVDVIETQDIITESAVVQVRSFLLLLSANIWHQLLVRS